MSRSLYACTHCREHPDGKLANVTIASRWNGPSRVAYRLRLCMTCYCTKVLPIEVPADAEVLTCPSCHIDVEDNMEPVFVTSYLPGVGKVEVQAAFCTACVLLYRPFAELGLVLEDTLSRGQDPGPSTTATGLEGWAAVGLYPRG